ncbi:MAG: hypothetical protein OHK0015_02830 [Chloroflexi bacterium OHK40]
MLQAAGAAWPDAAKGEAEAGCHLRIRRLGLIEVKGQEQAPAALVQAAQAEVQPLDELPALQRGAALGPGVGEPFVEDLQGYRMFTATLPQDAARLAVGDGRKPGAEPRLGAKGTQTPKQG